MNIKNTFLVMLMLTSIGPQLSANQLSNDRMHLCIEKTKQLSTDCKKALTDLFKRVRKRSAHYTSQINPVVATGSASLVVAAGLAYQEFKARSDQKSPNPGSLLPKQRECPLEAGTMKTGEFPYSDGMHRQGGLATEQPKRRLQDVFTPPAETANEASKDNLGDLPVIEEDFTLPEAPSQT
jgi:hypothetical protein